MYHATAFTKTNNHDHCLRAMLQLGRLADASFQCPDLFRPDLQVGFKATGRRCMVAGCVGRLRDHILDWEDALPEDELQKTEQHAEKADVALCLGTSLQITPACNLPLKTVKKGTEVVCVNDFEQFLFLAVVKVMGPFIQRRRWPPNLAVRAFCCDVLTQVSLKGQKQKKHVAVVC